MNTKQKRKLIQSLFILLFWIVSVTLLNAFSIYSIIGFMEVAGLELHELDNVIAAYWLSPNQYLESTIFGLLFGTLFLVVNEISDRYHWDRLSFVKVIALKSLIYIVGFVLTFIIIYLVIDTLGFYPDNIHELEFGRGLMITGLCVITFILFNILLLNYIVQSNKKMGDFNITSFLTGKYREPVMEDRLFMFLDLKSSTTLAEELGPLRYSKLISQSFKDLNQVVSHYPLDIYQYVGDEAVITGLWQKGNILKMIDCFFAFLQRLEKRKAFYLKHFNHQPIFKAGIHGGRVSATEIGTLRRDIAFHGDVINTASRLQGLCNDLHEDLLISAELAEEVEHYEIISKGSHQLKGRIQSLAIAAIKQ